MDLNCFFEALEELANRLFSTNTPGRDDSYENLRKLIQIIKKYVPPSKSYYTIFTHSNRSSGTQLQVETKKDKPEQQN